MIQSKQTKESEITAMSNIINKELKYGEREQQVYKAFEKLDKAYLHELLSFDKFMETENKLIHFHDILVMKKRIKHGIKQKPKEKLYRKCFKCDTWTRDTNHLRKHTKREHPSSLYKCHLCTFEAWSKMELLDHKNIKHNPAYRGVRCKDCDKVYKSLKSLRRHISVKHNPSFEPFKCPHCEKVYQTKCGMKRHIERVHL
jgi:KRAB domain-containing zinc finger protein